MRAVLVNATEDMVTERRRLGIDKRDECWEGEWHFANPPKLWHADVNSNLFLVLAPLARATSLRSFCEAVGIFGAPRNWRVPDQVHARPEDLFEDGARSAGFVVEVRSPGDESHEKIPFYAERGVTELLIVHQDRTVELYRLRADGQLVRVENETGGARSAVLDCTFRTVEGPLLLVSWPDGSATV